MLSPRRKCAASRGRSSGPVAQRRNVDGGDVQPIVEIFAEGFFRNEFRQVLVGGGDDTHVDGYGHPSSQAVHFSAFEGAQELCLEVCRHVTDFIQEYGAAVGQFELAGFRRNGAGEGAAFEAEKFAFQERVGDGGTVEHDKGAARPAAEQVEHFGHQFLARAALARDEHGRFEWSNAPDQGLHLLHAFAPADDPFRGIGRGDLLSQCLDLLLQPALFQRPPDDDFHLLEAERLAEEIVGPALDGLEGGFARPVSGDDDDLALGFGFPDVRDGLDPGHAREPDVQENQVVDLLADLFQARFRRPGYVRFVAPLRQEFPECHLHGRFIVHHEYSCRHDATLRGLFN